MRSIEEKLMECLNHFWVSAGRNALMGGRKKSSKNKSLHPHTSQVLISGASSGLIAFSLNGRTEIKQRTE